MAGTVSLTHHAHIIWTHSLKKLCLFWCHFHNWATKCKIHKLYLFICATTHVCVLFKVLQNLSMFDICWPKIYHQRIQNLLLATLSVQYMTNIFTFAYGQGRGGCPPLTVSLTIKRPFFYYSPFRGAMKKRFIWFKWPKYGWVYPPFVNVADILEITALVVIWDASDLCQPVGTKSQL